ncbi:MAG TPA: hypothetical protein VKP67_03115 [Xanthobacteraceae bacterium]|nr:hypothetical protein [Xanthobacteraceae bacterium]
MPDVSTIRRGVIVALTRRLNDKLGRTGLMKLIYFLQTVKGVPLKYDFRLYTYGPYDSQVLDDLMVTQALGGIRSRAFQWSAGTGYVLSEGEKASAVMQPASTAIAHINEDLDWVVGEFGSMSASDLEIASTIIYVDRDCEMSGEKISESELATRVQQIKRHHDKRKIALETHRLRERQMLHSISG